MEQECFKLLTDALFHFSYAHLKKLMWPRMLRYFSVFMLLDAEDTGIATGGHGWACAHPFSARVGREICTDLKSFFGGVGVG